MGGSAQGFYSWLCCEPLKKSLDLSRPDSSLTAFSNYCYLHFWKKTYKCAAQK